MTNHNFEGQFEGDWEERGFISWSELDWQRFLQRQEQEIARFLRLYDSANVPDVERLDWIAKQMGWDAEDWSVSDPTDEDEFNAEAWQNQEQPEPADPEDIDPYTVHRHPVFVVSSGLLLQVRYLWRSALERFGPNLQPLQLWDFAQTLHDTDRQVLIAMQCMDMGDLLLCVVHFKRALRGINAAMHILPQLCSGLPLLQHTETELLKRLFDLREVCLRVIADCRMEDSRE